MMCSKKTLSRTALVLAACFLCALPAAPASLAETSDRQEDRSVFFGRVTAIDGNTLTVAIGTITTPEIPEGGESGETAPPAGTAPFAQGSGNLADRLTLTGESVVLQITQSITFTRQAARLQDGQRPDASFPGAMPEGSTPPGGTEQNDDRQPQGTFPPGSSQGQRGGGMMGWTGEGEAATLADLSVGSTVMLTYQTSTQALLAIRILAAGESANE